MIELHTPRLILRPWKEEDLAPFALMNADPEVREFFPSTLTQKESDDSVALMMELAKKNGFCFMAAELKENQKFIGMIGINQVNPAYPFAPAVEIGWRLAKEFWGYGYATEGAKALLDYGFNTLHLKEIVAFTVPNNLKSQQVMKRLGMSCDRNDDFDHPLVAENNPCRRHVLYKIQRENLCQVI